MGHGRIGSHQSAITKGIAMTERIFGFEHEEYALVL